MNSRPEPEQNSPRHEATPRTARTVAFAAFTGWNDAGGASSEALSHIMAMCGQNEGPGSAERVIDANAYIDFQMNRPHIVRNDDGTRVIEWPHTRIVTLNEYQGIRPVVITGAEPSLRWREFCAEILAVLESEGITTLVTLGALLADTPHTRPLPVSARRVGDESSDDDYEGPVGIPTVLAHEAHAAGIETQTIWVQVPNYIGQNPAPKATLALLNALEQTLEWVIDLGDIPEDAEAWERGMDELARMEPEIAAYVTQLERVKDESELPEASGDAIASQFEQFLRRREDGADGSL